MGWDWWIVGMVIAGGALLPLVRSFLAKVRLYRASVVGLKPRPWLDGAFGYVGLLAPFVAGLMLITVGWVWLMFVAWGWFAYE